VSVCYEIECVKVGRVVGVCHGRERSAWVEQNELQSAKWLFDLMNTLASDSTVSFLVLAVTPVSEG